MSKTSKLRRVWWRFRSAITGRFVKAATARRHPDATVRERGGGWTNGDDDQRR